MNLSMVDGFSEMGGGALPGENIPTKLVCIHSDKINAIELANKLQEFYPSHLCKDRTRPCSPGYAHGV